MTKKRVLAGILVSAMMLSMTACGGGSGAGTVAGTSSGTGDRSSESPDVEARSLVFSTQFSVGNRFETDVLPVLKAKLAEKTDGKLTIEYYGGATLNAPNEMVEAVSSGMCDIACIMPALYEGQLPVSYMVAYPVYTLNGVAASYAMNGWMKEQWNAGNLSEFKSLGITPLMCTATALGGLATVGKPVESIADFSGMEIRASDLLATVVAGWGGTGVSIATNETYEALRSGIVQGAILGSDGIHDLALDEICEYFTFLPVFNAGFLYAINDNTLNSLPAEWQAALQEAFDETFEEVASYYIELSCQDAYDTVLDRGLNIIQLDDASIIAMEDTAKTVAQQYAASLDSKGLNGTQALKSLWEHMDSANQTYTESHSAWVSKNVTPIQR